MFVNKEELTTAMGPFQNNKQKQFYNGMCNLFKPMKKPSSGDWLQSHKQDHQAFSNYRLPFYNPVTPERKTIYLQQFGQFNQAFIQQLRRFCQHFYPTLLVKSLPVLQFQTELAHIKRRKNDYGNQYLAQDILAYMQKRVPKDAYCVMGITLQDIYPGANWNFVYGWAKYKARVGIFSFLRWDQEFAGGQTKEINWNLILYPSMRCMVHQIGHMFGITHCVYYRCLMNGFNHIEENYLNPLQFCPICFRKIFTNIGFDRVERYQNLINYCEKSEQKQLKKDELLYEQLIKLTKRLPFTVEKIQKTVMKTQTVAKPKVQTVTKTQTVAKPKVQTVMKTQTVEKPKVQTVLKPKVTTVGNNLQAPTFLKPTVDRSKSLQAAMRRR